MIYTVLQGNEREIVLLESQIRNQTARMTEESLDIVRIRTKEEFEDFTKEVRHADLICADVSAIEGVRQIEMLRERYKKAIIVLVADIQTSPVTYMKPTILASALLLKPLKETIVKQTVEEVFRCCIQETTDEEVFIVEAKDEKYRLPYSEILYFESRSKKIYACTANDEYGFYDTMDRLEEQCMENFVRCHRGFIVNREKVEKVRLSQNYLILQGGVEIPLSRSYKSVIKELY